MFAIGKSLTTLSTTTSPLASFRRDCILAIPLGATEQHGPHLPLTTDTDIALAVADRLAAQRPEVVVAPALAYGASDEHAAFPGTLSIGTEAMTAVVLALGRSAARTWRRVLLLNAHGGNASALSSAVTQLRNEGLDVRAWSPNWRGDAHAGHVETSVMLSVRPEGVNRAAAAAGETRPLAEVLEALQIVGVAEVSPNGVLGDPTTANEAAGIALLDAAVSDVVDLTARWQDQP